jgi:anti-sigma factor RsiW
MSGLDDATLVAFVDGELDPDAMHAVAQALANDPAAQEKVRLLRLSAPLVKAVFRQPSFQAVSPEVERALTPRRRWLPRLGPVRAPLALAASIAMLVIGLGTGLLIGDRKPAPTQFGERLLEEVADYHVVYARETEHLVEVPASQREHIEAWLGEHLHRSLRVPDLGDRGLAFEGARLLVVDGRSVAQLLYAAPGDEHHPLALCIAEGAASDAPTILQSREGINLAAWRAGGYFYVLAGWQPQTFLKDVAAEVSPELNRG